MNPTKLILEMVPPLIEEGKKGLDECLHYIKEVHNAQPLNGINIPEIHEESAHNKQGIRLRSFEPRMPPREFARHIRNVCDLPCIVNHVVVHEPASALEQWLQESYHDFGVTQFVLVGGEHHEIDYPGPGVCEANTLCLKVLSAEPVKIGNICIPTRNHECERVKKKVDAGASFFTTQVIYQPQELSHFTRQLLTAGIPAEHTDFYFSFCPVKSEKNLRFLNWLGVVISQSLEDRLLADSSRTLEISLQHIIDTWHHYRKELKGYRHPINANINLCPIGSIGAEVTIELARALQQ